MKYWLVHNPNRGAPAKQHMTIESAQEEAKRLAAKHTGESVYVLEVVGVAVTQPQPVAYAEVK